MIITRLRGAIRGRLRCSLAARIAKDDSGVAALEFGLAAPIFFALLISIFDVAAAFGTSVLLDSAASNGSRALRTGQVYITTTDPLLDSGGETICANQQVCAFEAAMCEGLFFMSCSDLSYDVQAYYDFQSASTGVTCDANGRIVSPRFNIGEPAQTVVVTVMYNYQPIIPNPLMFTGRDWGAVKASGCSGAAMQSTMVFRNEPFPRNTSGTSGGGSG